jgi:hypothetical protein
MLINESKAARRYSLFLTRDWRPCHATRCRLIFFYGCGCALAAALRDNLERRPFAKKRTDKEILKRWVLCLLVTLVSVEDQGGEVDDSSGLFSRRFCSSAGPKL